MKLFIEMFGRGIIAISSMFSLYTLTDIENDFIWYIVIVVLGIWSVTTPLYDEWRNKNE